MQPTSSGGLRHPDASEFSEHPIKEVPEVSLKLLGFLGLNRGRLRGRVFKIGILAVAPSQRRFALARIIVCCGASIVAHFARKVRATNR